MKTRAMMALATGCLLLTAATLCADDKEKKDPDALQGTWKVESFTQDGNEAPAEFAKAVSFTFKDKKYTITMKGKEMESGTFKLDPEKKTIDLDITSGNDKGKKQVGIYKLEKDNFTICLAHPGATDRPTKMESTKDGETIMGVMKREKK
jgi:uncharacterized protein (TIGR03067 family)